MTLIACFHPSGRPTFLADRVISSLEGRSGFSLPTVGGRHDKVPTKLRTKLHGTMAKILRPSERILMLFSGPVESARRISTGIATVFGELSVPMSVVRAYVEANFADELGQISMILNVWDEGGSDTWWRQCYVFESPHIGQVLLAGSGAERAIRFLENLPDFSNIPNRIDYCSSTFAALALSGALLGDEMRTGEPLALGFGGYYDIISMYGLEAREIVNVSYTFWFGREHENGDREFNFPSKVLRKFRWARGTGIHAVELPSPPFVDKYSWEVLLESTDGIPSRSHLPTLPKLPPLNTDWRVDCAIFDKSEAIFSALQVSVDGNRKHMVNFGNRRGKLGMYIDTERLRNWLRPAATGES